MGCSPVGSIEPVTPRRLRGGAALALVPAVLAACYTYRPAAGAPAPNTYLALVLNDQGRVGAGDQVGPAVARVEGTLVAATDTGYVVQVAAVEGISGARQRWGGELVTLRSDHVGNVLERRFATGRTIAAVVGFGGALVALIATRGLGVLGGGDGNGGPPGNGNGEQ
jgi:hypothetical protein